MVSDDTEDPDEAVRCGELERDDDGEHVHVVDVDVEEMMLDDVIAAVRALNVEGSVPLSISAITGESSKNSSGAAK